MTKRFILCVPTSLLCLVILSAFCLPLRGQEEGKRIALIIGNNHYTMSPLRNAVNDARLMDKSLRAAGFKTILREDASLTAMEEAAAEFASQLGPDDTALFFYAGHGVQIESENFLVPVDFEAANTVIEAKFKCFRVSQLFDELKRRSKRNIIILDACRSNPVAESHSLQAGLAQPQLTGKETFVAFSTSPGQVAADNPSGRDSWFTEALADLIDQPGLSLDDVFTRVKARVSTETESRQSPWTISSLTSTFYFHAPANLQAVNDPSVAEKWMLDAQRSEQHEEWNQAIDLLNQVIKRKPGGILESTAVEKLSYVTLLRDAQTKFDAADYKDAAVVYEKTLALDPFASDTAFAAVDSYLLGGDIPGAVHALSLVRQRGTSASVKKANAMLQQLGVAYPAAAKVAREDIPSPPPVQELFDNVRFDVPDWSAGVRLVQSSPVQVARWIKALEDAYPPPPDPEDVKDQTATKVAMDVLHVEVAPVGEGRDLAIRRLNTAQAGPTGSLMLIGSLGDTKILANGNPVAERLPATLKLPPGQYEIRTVEHGQVVTSQMAEVVAFQTRTITVEGRK